MSTRLDHGYSVKRDNEVLRGVSIYSGEDRAVSLTDYHVVRIGMKVGRNVEWLATWSQRVQALKEGEPLSILPVTRQGMRLRHNSAIVVELTTTGNPSAIQGSAVDLDLSLTGGSAGIKRPLISGGEASHLTQDLVNAINRSGLADKVARVALEDTEAPAGIMDGEYTPTRSETIGTTQVAVIWGTLTVGTGVTITVNGKLLVMNEPYGI